MKTGGGRGAGGGARGEVSGQGVWLGQGGMLWVPPSSSHAGSFSALGESSYVTGWFLVFF